ncbi:short chain dehydrogenase reductase [Aspergillus stella-maris]|uniref:short chain dehydrogenase reductase n=1 Tax=Aspergillus stella-maris TaxID=1810926 RepID=UPI003CCDC36D
MTTINISDECIPKLNGQVAVITGGGSGIGLAVVRLLAAKGARVFILDQRRPDGSTIPTPADLNSVLPPSATFIPCDVTSWPSLQAVFAKIIKQAGRVDMAFANAGTSEARDYSMDILDDSGNLAEPDFAVMNVNFRAVVNFIKLGVYYMKRQSSGGRIVITSSATAYVPEQSLPIYSASKAATITLVRSLRSVLIQDNITINAVAPAATLTALLPPHLAKPIATARLPISTSLFVARALVYSANARQEHRVENYGIDKPETDRPARWNGRVILTLGEEYTELEEPLSECRADWFGARNTELTRAQKEATDFRILQTHATKL